MRPGAPASKLRHNPSEDGTNLLGQEKGLYQKPFEYHLLHKNPPTLPKQGKVSTPKVGTAWVQLGLKLTLTWTQHAEHGPEKCSIDAKLEACWAQKGSTSSFGHQKPEKCKKGETCFSHCFRKCIKGGHAGRFRALSSQYRLMLGLVQLGPAWTKLSRR